MDVRINLLTLAVEFLDTAYDKEVYGLDTILRDSQRYEKEIVRFLAQNCIPCTYNSWRRASHHAITKCPMSFRRNYNVSTQKL